MADTTFVVLEGWLTKSSTNKQPWKARWKKLWFVLRSTGQIPGQYTLQYYTNEDSKKPKGSLNLDEVEQVDAGLTLRFSSGNKSHKYIFDIRTKAKEYYFATSSEEEMNQWVKSLCSVCNLKLATSPDDNVPTTSPVDYRYSPQPNSTRSAPSLPVASSSSSENNNSTNYSQLHHRINRPSKLPTSASVVIHHEKNASISSCESSGPYIPISECHSGNPADARVNDSLGDVKNTPMVGGISVNKNVILADELYDFPKSATSSSTNFGQPNESPSAVKSAHPPGDDSNSMNWLNFPTNKDDIIRASVRSCSALDSSKGNSTLTRDSRNSQSFHSASRLRGASSTVPSRDVNLYTNGNNNCENIANDTNHSLPGRVPPPRPPKPATLRRSKSKSHSNSSLGAASNVNSNELVDDHQKLSSVPQVLLTTVTADESYAIPKSSIAVNKDTFVHMIDQVVPPPSVYVRGKLENVNEASPPPPPFSHSRAPEVVSDDLQYDIPRSLEVINPPPPPQPAAGNTVDLDARVPMPSFSKKDIGGKHSYTNAASGFISTKESVFNYEYNPSLPVTSEDQTTLSPDTSHASSNVTDKSPRTPNSAFSPGNESTPPAVDRKFKPRKNQGSESDATASPTTPHSFTLSPAPAKGSFSTSTLPSSKSFKNGQHSYDSATRSCNTLGHRASSGIGAHVRGHSISEDNPSSKDAKTHLPRRHKQQIPEKPELEYLDLDHNDSDHSSPRTPNLIFIEPNNHATFNANRKSTVTSPMKEKNISGLTAGSTIIQSTTSKSTVYKTVDFVKTDALNKLRHTLQSDQGN